MAHPVFFDPTGNRRRWTGRGFASLILLALLLAGLFAVTLIDVPSQGDLPLEFERPQPAPLRTQISALDRRVRANARAIAGWLPHDRAPATPPTANTMAFYVPWDASSGQSLAQHIGAIDTLVPSILNVTGHAHQLREVHDNRLTRILAHAVRRPAIMPMVQNADAGRWDGGNTARLFARAGARTALVQALAARVARDHDAGLVFDFENLPAASLPAYRQLLRQARSALHGIGARTVVTIPAGDTDWSPKAFAAVADQIMLMNYDYHWQGGESGPIAPQPWFVAQLRDTIRAAGRDKLILTVGSYAYDWHDKIADALTIEEAWLAAHDSGSRIQFDPVSGNAGFGYEDRGVRHAVWMLDAASLWNELRAAKALGVGNVALWRLGSEDPGVWPALTAFRQRRLPDLRRIDQVSNADVEGTGEILRVTATPQSGSRSLRFDRSGLIRNERYDVLPTPFVVNRTGALARQVALTFDDGPDPDWTPAILNILEKAHVPATFFVIGENALSNPGLLNRIVADGSEIGNHTYTHPNLALASAEVTRLELNATQRLIEAYTGRSTRLFRAPYFGDAEPTTADELLPALAAQQQGYSIVGLHVDPGDWKRPGVAAIVNATVADVESPSRDRSHNIVLLHDGGGNRAQTVAALPQIIDRLTADGYRFVPVSALAGLSNRAVMPPVTGSDLAAVRADLGIFLILAVIGWVFKWLFFLAIALGLARAILIAGLALSSRPSRPRDPDYRPAVSVIIPAFNEARVIEQSVARVLASDYADLQVIVVDDGSRDGTSDIVRTVFGDDARVTLLTLANGGKARALNRALAVATADIVIALDADTQFEPTTIARLARWFADPAIGAVAGNAKVGNRVNLVTRWQAVEYVTAQNLERRALARFRAITVVPGAVGAWRRAALDAVGGYPEDTLAEDQDLTIAIQRAGWRVDYDADAIAWTEAPESFRALAKQRYRWAFGTLQCLWKHRAVIGTGRPAGLARVGMPQAWLFQIGFAAISPFIDLALIVSVAATSLRVAQHGWAQTQTDVLTMAAYWAAFTAIDLVCGGVAYALDGRERRYPGLLLIAQRFVYRQIMYGVVIRAIGAALGGWWVGWGKLERTGTVSSPETLPAG